MRLGVAIEKMLKTLEVVLIILEGFLRTVFGDFAVFEKFTNVLRELHLGRMRLYFYSSTGVLEFQGEIVSGGFFEADFDNRWKGFEDGFGFD